MPSYLTKAQAEDRLLARYGIDTTLGTGDVDAASDELDASGPFISQKKDSAQARAFPRSLLLDGTDNTAGTVPDAVLDAVALLAYHAASNEGPAVTAESMDGVSATYATPAEPLAFRRVRALLSPYFLKVGRRAGERVYSSREDFER